MACHKIFLVISLMLVVSLVNAVEFSVIDNTGDSPGGKIFREQIGGASYGEQAMRSATDFVWRVFQQDNPSDRRDTPMITLIMENSKDLAYSSQDKIHYNAGALVNDGGDVKRGFNGVIYHEVVHSWQWNGANLAPVGLIEGIADFVRLKAGFAASHWVAPGGDVTMRFLDYCNELRNGFVAELNKKMRTGYNDGFFVDLLGKDVNQLWTEYKARYGQ